MISHHYDGCLTKHISSLFSPFYECVHMHVGVGNIQNIRGQFHVDLLCCYINFFIHCYNSEAEGRIVISEHGGVMLDAKLWCFILFS